MRSATPLVYVLSLHDALPIFRSPVAVPAVPLKLGVLSLVGELTAFRVTLGATVSTTKVRSRLEPVLPAESLWKAFAVQVPSASEREGARSTASHTGAADAV